MIPWVWASRFKEKFKSGRLLDTICSFTRIGSSSRFVSKDVIPAIRSVARDAGASAAWKTLSRLPVSNREQTGE